MPETKNYSNMSLSALDAELSTELGIIEQYKDNSVRQSAKFWGAVERRNQIRAELQERQPHSYEVEILPPTNLS